ncbi:MAG TPA: tlde1 domain-containing protein [Lichenihabitans sp.]|jgi:hypothetical protein|nr:tlde1 domain-containing protein [Lichenihabitans sp.]
MTHATATALEFSPFDCRHLSGRSSPRTVGAAIVVASLMLAGACTLDYIRSRDSGPSEVMNAIGSGAAASRVAESSAAAPRIARDAAPGVERAAPTVGEIADAPRNEAASAGPKTYAALLDPDYSLGPAPAALAQSEPLGAGFEPSQAPPLVADAAPTIIPPAPAASSLAADAAPEIVPPAPAASSLVQSIPASASPMAPLPPSPAVLPPIEQPAPAPAIAALAQSVPLPAPRPSELHPPAGPSPFRTASRRFAQRNIGGAPTATSADNRNFFEKLFGMPRPSGPLLAYAAPDDGELRPAPGLAIGSQSYDQWTAVYDIAAHTVYMPDGTKLEAHSGLGNRLDDPRYVSERMRGPTPPHVYDLQPREQLFHGVQALRLNPVGGGGVFGRTGLLAHTYMLGPNGDSNGCVSFRRYDAFLQAFMHGEVRRLAVVARR